MRAFSLSFLSVVTALLLGASADSAEPRMSTTPETVLPLSGLTQDVVGARLLVVNERTGPVVATARTRPEPMCWMIDSTAGNMSCASPATTAATAPAATPA